MQFKSIVGQEALKQKFIKSINEGRVPHAQLFIGATGTGKLALAIGYAQYLMCTNRTDGDSCGECPSCKKIEKLIHPDLHFVYPLNATEKQESAAEDDSFNDTIALWRYQILNNPYLSESDWYDVINIKNKQGIINAATASAVIKDLSLKSYESNYKVMIIWLPERMNSTAANKLLKLIEEPPQNTVFILVSENPSLLLKTITSRTQQVLVPPIKGTSIAKALVDKFEVEPTRAADISRISNGSYSNAILLKDFEKGVYFDNYTQLMRLSYSKNYLGLLSWVEDITKLGREGIKEFISYSLRITRNSLMLNLGLNNLSFMIGEEEAFGRKFSPFINEKNIFRIVAEFTKVNEHISQNANANVVFTDFVIKMAGLINPTK